ncbi:helix-turn-helix transcriptional regulator [Microbacterium hominis]|uniref:helix-turn-helix domain-containing protein n=1 Tax=Microbacterium hominis TaxID=162426 RepID=UPI00168BF57D|nr:helix-turn-helix transcriptional regulator [Microbacterium hominis]QOC27425.1 helix-turn-helix transcriptional regulator [Microbacterium hominis]QOC30496.1 helix-turn-helix transcriptional regulator [Microbacterium hominis]
MQTWEANFRANVKDQREAVGMTQTDLARAMRERGFGFHQQTVQRVESGERPVRLDEAFSIAEILGVPLDALASNERLQRAQSELRRTDAAHRRLVDAVNDYESQRLAFSMALDVLADGQDEIIGTDDLTRVAGGWVELTSADVARGVMMARAAGSGVSVPDFPGLIGIEVVSPTDLGEWTRRYYDRVVADGGDSNGAAADPAE